jgi:hypothetical protein
MGVQRQTAQQPQATTPALSPTPCTLLLWRSNPRCPDDTHAHGVPRRSPHATKRASSRLVLPHAAQGLVCLQGQRH